MTPEEIVLLIILVNSLLVAALVIYLIWWHLWGKPAHYRKVIAWSEAANYRHHEYKDAKAYFKKHRRAT